jgi:ABC-type multidrug transport system ATPase subunit
VVIISDGTLVADGRPDELVAREQSNRFRLLLESGDAAPVLDRIRGIAGVRDAARDAAPSAGTGLQIVVTTDAGRDIRRELFQAAVDNRWPLLELERQEASLEEVFRRLTRVEDPASGGKVERAA